MAIFNKCCCCIPLPIGVAILGGLSFIGSIIMVANNINTFRLSQELYADYVPPSERVIPQNISMFFSNVTEEWNPKDLLVDSGPSKEFVYFSITCYILCSSRN